MAGLPIDGPSSLSEEPRLLRTTDETKRRLQNRRGLWFQKERLEGTMDHRRMSLMIGMEGLNRFLPILGPIPHPNRAFF